MLRKFLVLCGTLFALGGCSVQTDEKAEAETVSAKSLAAVGDACTIDADCAAGGTVCSAHTCNQVTKLCEAAPINNGGGCDTDGTVGCTGTCNAGACDTGATKTAACNALDTVCDNKSCDGATGTCQTNAINNGGGCDTDGTNGCAGTCSAGTCNTGATKTAACDASDTVCDNKSCDGATGTCQSNATNNGGGCDADGTVGCSGTCNAGTCNTGASKTSACNGSDNFCNDGSCDDTTGTCSTVARNVGLGCEKNSGSPTAGCSFTCAANGSCNGSSKTSDCDGLDTYCLNSSCNSSTGQCTSQSRNDALGCATSGSAASCSGGICNAGVCVAGTTKSVDCASQAAPQCRSNYCAADGSCQQAITTGSTCSDGAACTSADKCSATGFCVGTPNNNSCTTPACGTSSCVVESSGVTAGCVDTPINGIECAPATECTNAATCGTAGTSCPVPSNKPNSTNCGAAPSCNASTGVITLQAKCTGGGACAAPATTDCAPFKCTAGPACRTSCANDSDCVSDAFCNTTSNRCETKKTSGTACNGANQCATGICVVEDGAAGGGEGICCNTSCGGSCQTCESGTCTAVTTGQPVGQRAACVSHAICGGACAAGNTATCTYPGASTECKAEACTTDGLGLDSYQAKLTCSAGACVNEATPATSCGGAICQLGKGCLGGCLNDTQCGNGYYCPNAGALCLALKAPAAVCTRSGECESGSCVDGVCCDSGCSGLCEACNVPGKVGTCSPAAAGVQPVGARPDCGGTAPCQGSCDGTNRFACSFPGATTACGAASCSGTTAVPAGACDSAGSCAKPSSVDCAPNACAGGVCSGDCSKCTATQTCIVGACVDKVANGELCASNDACTSGQCVDGTCCSSACTGQCEACNVVGSEGTCSPVPTGSGPRGARTPCATDGTACGGTCDGVVRTTCSYADEATSCGAASCSNGLATLERLCLGNGSCSAVTNQLCSVGCSGTACTGTCPTTPCAAGSYCSAGECVPALTNGSDCSLATQCASGKCVDGTCCNTDCASSCEECSTGTCANRGGAPLPGRTPCDGVGTCGGTCSITAPTCIYAANTVTCGNPSCVGGYAVSGSTCNAAGSCAPASGTICTDGLLCAGNVCATTCTADTDCASGLICESGTCATPVVTPLGTGGTGTGGAATGGGTGTGGLGLGGADSLDELDAIDKGSCGCSVPGGTRDDRGWFLLAGAAALVVARFARRRQSAA